MHKYLFFTLAIVTSFSVHGQIGGKRTYEFLNVPVSARLSALGGVNTSFVDRDVTFFMSNPALISDSLSGWASANYLFYVADIGQASFAYTHPFKKIGTLHMGIQHMNYGELDAYDETGLSIGSFKSSETALYIGKSHQISNFRLGVNMKMVFSSIAGYRSNAIMFDVGGVFVHPVREFTVGMAIKNVGFRLSEYSTTSNSILPFDIQIGSTIKPEHMPLRFSLSLYNLYALNKAYDDPSTTDDDPSSLDKVLRHFSFGSELLLHKNFNILVGYNYQRRQELKLENAGGSAGVSLGLAIKIKSLDVVVSRSGYSVGAAGYTFSVAGNIDNMIKRKEL